MNPSARTFFSTALVTSCMAAALGASSAPAAPPPPLAIAYFVPSDRQPLPRYQERIDRVMSEVQRFYREGMLTNGYDPLTFGLERDGQGRLRILVVKGRYPMKTYGRNDASKVRSEVEAALTAQGLEVNRRTLLIFQVLLDWQDGRAVEVGPYVGGGSHLSGTAWVYDDEKLDAALLESKERGGYYGGPCSVGEFNSHYVGGVAHELGHALGLPHVRGPKSIPRHSLMGDGNHTYGQERRGQGAGSYLHPASAMLLAKCRPFAGEVPGAGQPATCTLSSLKATHVQDKLVLEGSVEARPPAFGVIAYNDAEAIPADYDALGVTGQVDSQGRFRLEIGELRAGRYQLRLQAVQANGAHQTFAFEYDVNAQGVPETGVFAQALRFNEVMEAYGRRDRARVETLTRALEREFPGEPATLAKAAHLRALMDPKPPVLLSSLPATVTNVPVSSLQFASQRVGWGQPLRDQVLREGRSTCFIQVDGQAHMSGLFAHAPSVYKLELNGGWQRLQSGYGLQDGSDGSVVFIVRADGREVFRSGLVRNHRLRQLTVPVAGVKVLELVVEDGGDGSRSDWGVWVAPKLER